MVSPARRRDAVSFLTRRHKVSERRACRLVGQHRSTNRYRVQPSDFEEKLVKRMNALAEKNPRFGYRRIWALLRAEGFAVNRKRIERLWAKEGHRVPPQRKQRGQRAIGSSSGAAQLLPATHPDHIWSYDFLSARTRDGGPIRVLNVVDEFTRRSVGHRVAKSIGAGAVRESLEEIFELIGKPEMIRSDNGREFTSSSLTDWLREQSVIPVFIEKASPYQNPFVERFNGSMRNELLNGESFENVLEARVVIAEWIDRYNNARPHQGLGYETPAAFFESCRVGSA